jgi:hypothetical protein
MSKQFSSAEIIQQNAKFEQAYRSGQITQGQYEHAMRVQSANLKAAQAREAQQQAQAPPQASTQLPPSNYWTTMPTPEKPSVLPTTEAEHVAAGGTQIIPPTGYIVTNVQPTMVEAQGPIAPGKTKADMMAPAVSYELQEKPKPVQQSDLGIGSQLLIAAQLAPVAFGIVADKVTPKDSVANKLIKLEVQTAIQPTLAFEAGVVNAMETEAYGTASLAKSAVVSVQTGQLQYSPVKTPKLGPTVIGSTIGAVTGNSEEIQQMGKMPFGYAQGSVFGEVGLALIEGEAFGMVAGKTSQFVKTAVNPKINALAESTLAKTQGLAQAGLNRIQPGLGKATEFIISRDAVKAGKVLDIFEGKAGSAITNKVLNPIKYNVAAPVFDVASKAKSNVVSIGQRIIDIKPNSSEASNFMKSVAAPNLTNYSKVIRPTVKMYGDDLIQRTAQPIGDLRLATEPFRQTGKAALQTVKEPFIYSKSVVAPNQAVKVGALSSKVVNTTKYKVVDPVLNSVAGFKNTVFDDMVSVGQKANTKIQPIQKTTSVIGQSTVSKSNIMLDLIPKTAVKSVTSTKNIVTFDALMMAKNVAKQGKPITQLKYGASWGGYVPLETTTVKEQAQKQQPKVVSTYSLMSVGMPKTTAPYPRTGQRNREEIEIVSYPTSQSDLDVRQPSRIVPAASIIPSFLPIPGTAISPNITPNIYPNITPRPDTKIIPQTDILPSTNISPAFIDVVIPREATTLEPTQLTRQQPINILGLSPREKQRNRYPSEFKFDTSGPNMFFPMRSSRSKKALRLYPVMTPKKLLNLVL